MNNDTAQPFPPFIGLTFQGILQHIHTLHIPLWPYRTWRYRAHVYFIFTPYTFVALQPPHVQSLDYVYPCPCPNHSSSFAHVNTDGYMHVHYNKSFFIFPYENRFNRLCEYFYKAIRTFALIVFFSAVLSTCKYLLCR